MASAALHRLASSPVEDWPAAPLPAPDSRSISSVALTADVPAHVELPADAVPAAACNSALLMTDAEAAVLRRKAVQAAHGQVAGGLRVPDPLPTTRVSRTTEPTAQPTTQPARWADPVAFPVFGAPIEVRPTTPRGPPTTPATTWPTAPAVGAPAAPTAAQPTAYITPLIRVGAPTATQPTTPPHPPAIATISQPTAPAAAPATPPPCPPHLACDAASPVPPLALPARGPPPMRGTASSTPRPSPSGPGLLGDPSLMPSPSGPGLLGDPSLRPSLPPPNLLGALGDLLRADSNRPAPRPSSPSPTRPGLLGALADLLHNDSNCSNRPTGRNTLRGLSRHTSSNRSNRPGLRPSPPCPALLKDLPQQDSNRFNRSGSDASGGASWAPWRGRVLPVDVDALGQAPRAGTAGAALKTPPAVAPESPAAMGAGATVPPEAGAGRGGGPPGVNSWVGVEDASSLGDGAGLPVGALVDELGGGSGGGGGSGSSSGSGSGSSGSAQEARASGTSAQPGVAKAELLLEVPDPTRDLVAVEPSRDLVAPDPNRDPELGAEEQAEGTGSPRAKGAGMSDAHLFLLTSCLLILVSLVFCLVWFLWYVPRYDP